MRILAPVAFATCLAAAPVGADDYTDAQLLELFQTQRDAFRAARQSPLGQTRGLELITVDTGTDTDIDVTTDMQGLTAAASPDEGVAVSISTEQDVARAGDLRPLQAPGGRDAVATADAMSEAPAPRLAEPAPTTGTAQMLGDATPGDDAPAIGTQADPPPDFSGGTPTRLAAADDPNEPLIFGRLDPQLQVNLFIRFAFDSAALSDEQRPRLDQMCGVMQRSDVDLFRIVGHTDTAGTDDYNQRLSQLRAQEVRRYLVACGIAADRLETVGMGERFPINTDDTSADENRRVEFQALS